MDDISLLLSYIETAVGEGKKPVFGKGVIIDKDEILGYVDRIRRALPYATGEAVLAEANGRAQALLADAQKRHDEMVSASVAMNDARILADKIVKQATEFKTNSEFELRKKMTEILDRIQTDLSKASLWVENAADNLNVPISSENQTRSEQ